MKIKKINQSAGIVANVTDSLNSDSSVDALSAAAGKELNNKNISINEKMTELETIVNKYLKDDGIYFADKPVIYESSFQPGMRMLDDSLRLSDTLLEQHLRTEKDGPGTYLDSAGIGAIIDSFSTAIHNLWNAIDNLDNAAILTSRISVYFTDTHFDGRNFFAQKNGNLCTIWGISSPVTDTPFQMETGTEYIIATLPEGYRPTSTLGQKIFSTLVLRDSSFVEIDQSTINIFPDGSVAIRQRSGETKTVGQILINMTFPIDA